MRLRRFAHFIRLLILYNVILLKHVLFVLSSFYFVGS